jgi:hypothetical protein
MSHLPTIKAELSDLRKAYTVDTFDPEISIGTRPRVLNNRTRTHPEQGHIVVCNLDWLINEVRARRDDNRPSLPLPGWCR